MNGVYGDWLAFGAILKPFEELQLLNTEVATWQKHVKRSRASFVSVININVIVLTFDQPCSHSTLHREPFVEHCNIHCLFKYGMYCTHVNQKSQCTPCQMVIFFVLDFPISQSPSPMEDTEQLQQQSAKREYPREMFKLKRLCVGLFSYTCPTTQSAHVKRCCTCNILMEIKSHNSYLKGSSTVF